jgi:hypothetical protein
MESNRVQKMEVRLRQLRSMSVVGLVVSAPAALLAIVLMASSLTKPQLSSERLYYFSKLTGRIGFGSIFLGLSLSLILNSLARQLPLIHDCLRADFNRHRRLLSAFAAVVVILMATTLIPGFTFVHPSGNVWLSTSRAGTREVSELVARQYMWLLVRFSALFLALFAGSIGFESASILRSAKRVDSNVMTHN